MWATAGATALAIASQYLAAHARGDDTGESPVWVLVFAIAMCSGEESSGGCQVAATGGQNGRFATRTEVNHGSQGLATCAIG